MCTCHGKPQLIGVSAQGSWRWCSRDGAQPLADLLVVQGPGLDAIDATGLLLRRQQLHGTGAVAANGGQQIEGTGAGCGQEVVEPALHGGTSEVGGPEASR